MSDYLELQGKRALVTGGTKGIGAAVVAALRDAGATVLTTCKSLQTYPLLLANLVFFSSGSLPMSRALCSRSLQMNSQSLHLACKHPRLLTLIANGVTCAVSVSAGYT